MENPRSNFYFALYEEAAGAAGGVVDLHVWLGLEDAGHDGVDLGRGVGFACALTTAFGEFADVVFVALADDVGLDVFQFESLGGNKGKDVVFVFRQLVKCRAKTHCYLDGGENNKSGRMPLLCYGSVRLMMHFGFAGTDTVFGPYPLWHLGDDCNQLPILRVFR